MKKTLLSILTAVAVMHSVSGYAQTATFTTAAATAATPNADTVFFNLQKSQADISDNITGSGAGVTIKWKVIASNFPTDWLTSLGICDNQLCYYNSTNSLWNETSSTGSVQTSKPYTSTGIFYLDPDLSSSTSVGKYYMTILLSDAASSYSKTVTYIVAQYNTGVANISNVESSVVVYPNPAADEVNVVYSPDAGVKTIAIYNIIGKALKVYNTLDNSGAKLNIENVPSGIYFMRLMDAQGHIVATRKFTRQ